MLRSTPYFVDDCPVLPAVQLLVALFQDLLYVSHFRLEGRRAEVVPANPTQYVSEYRTLVALCWNRAPYLGQHDGDGDGPQERGLARHVGPRQKLHAGCSDGLGDELLFQQQDVVAVLDKKLVRVGELRVCPAAVGELLHQLREALRNVQKS